MADKLCAFLASNTLNKMSLLLLILGFFVCAADAQIDSSTLVRLHEHDWRLRRIAYLEVVKMHSKEAEDQLVDLLAEEESNFREAFVQGTGAEAKWGEEYVSYVDSLTQDVAKEYEQSKDPKALTVLLKASYNPGSQFAEWLADQGDAIVPTLIGMSETGTLYERESAVRVMGHFLRKNEARAASHTSLFDSIHAALARAAQDHDSLIRIDVAEALGEGGAQRDIPVLKALQRDNEFYTAKLPYPVRAAAEKALAAISVREGYKQ